MSLQTVRCHHIRWPLVQIVYLLFNTSCSYGDLNAAIRFGSCLTGAKINIIYEKKYFFHFKKNMMVMTRNPTREWNIKRPVKAYIQILPMWVDGKNILSKINNAPKTPLLIIYRAKLLKHDWLMWRESFREIITWSWLVETQRCESCYQEQKYKNKRYISLSHVIRQTLNPPFLREKWLN